MNATIDVDIGGTFTDCYVTHEGRRVWCKTRTTAYDLSVGMNETIEEAATRLGVTTEELLADAAIIRYSTTLAMNRLIERKGPKLGLLITEGFEDTTLIGRASQWSDGVPLKYQRNIAGIDRPEPLIPKELIVGVRERVDSNGQILRPLDEQDLLVKIQYLVDAGVRGFVVSLLWSFLEPAHERRIKEILEQEYHAAFLGAMPVFLSSDVAPRMYEYPRTMMTVLNAYLHQSMYEELSGIGDELRDRGYRRPMMMIHNTGGMASVLRTSAVNTYNGGPVAGLMGSAYIGGLYGYSNVVATDMGGTSFDIGMVAAGSPRFYQFMPIIDRWVVDATIVDCHSIGAGGGSIARVNELIAKRVEVGPESAGSMPGPAAYNQGGEEPTVTDADVVLGYVNPDNFHGGRIRLRPRARRARPSRAHRGAAGSLGRGGRADGAAHSRCEHGPGDTARDRAQGIRSARVHSVRVRRRGPNALLWLCAVRRDGPDRRVSVCAHLLCVRILDDGRRARLRALAPPARAAPGYRGVSR